VVQRKKGQGFRLQYTKGELGAELDDGHKTEDKDRNTCVQDARKTLEERD
jgi:hypothetical protein